MNNFYTYAYLREDGSPYYIGKGRGKRIDFKYRQKIKVPPKDRRIVLKQNLTEEEAFRHEIYMISVFGRKDLGTGILRNMSDGGEGVSGFSEETKRKLILVHLGSKRSEKSRKIMSESQIGNKNNLGNNHSEETKKKIRDAQIERLRDEEKRRIGKPRESSYKITFTDGKVEIIKNLSKWIREHNEYKSSPIDKRLSGKIDIWPYKDIAHICRY